VKLLLDEMWSPAIAQQLRRGGHYVEAVAERPELRGQPDEAIFAAAQAEDRAVVTENVIDYRPLAAQAMRRGSSHSGVIFTLSRTFPRDDNRTVGRMVRALHDLLASNPAPENFEAWL
jgi:predicted nuclease of predicted toxin-antitoxin system